jgi:hypothetical protein
MLHSAQRRGSIDFVDTNPIDLLQSSLPFVSPPNGSLVVFNPALATKRRRSRPAKGLQNCFSAHLKLD